MTAHIICRSLIQIGLQIPRWRTKWRPCKGMAVSQAFIINFKCYSLLHFAVCQLICWAFLLDYALRVYMLKPTKKTKNNNFLGWMANDRYCCYILWSNNKKCTSFFFKWIVSRNMKLFYCIKIVNYCLNNWCKHQQWYRSGLHRRHNNTDTMVQVRPTSQT